MIDTSNIFEKLLQSYRFKMARPYLIGDVLDFGGNKGELLRFVKGKYLVVNYDHSALKNANCDTIVTLAVIEHISTKKVFNVFKEFSTIINKGGRIVITTPTKMAKPVLEFWSLFGILDKNNIAEHKHYWTKEDIYNLATKSGFVVKKYKKFQLGFNQLAILEPQ